MDHVCDVAFVVLSIAAFFLMMMWGEEDKDHDTQRNAWKRFLLGGWFCSLWLRFIYQLRITETLGKHFLPIFKAIKHSLGFFSVCGSVHIIRDAGVLHHGYALR